MQVRFSHSPFKIGEEMAYTIKQFQSVNGAKSYLNSSNITIAPFEQGSVIYTKDGLRAAYVSRKLGFKKPRPIADIYTFISSQDPDTVTRKLSTQ